MSTQSIINALAGLSPDTDKATLMTAVDDAVDGIVKELDSQSGGKVEPDLVQATQATLSFLEACGQLKDPEFTQRARIRASELLEAFDKITNGGASDDGEAPRKKRRRKKRPTGPTANPSEAPRVNRQRASPLPARSPPPSPNNRPSPGKTAPIPRPSPRIFANTYASAPCFGMCRSIR